MRVREIMSTDVASVRPESTLQDAARAMRDRDVGPLAVCDGGERLVGMVTDRDLVVRGLAESRSLDLMRVREVMTEDGLHTCSPAEDVRSIERLMQDHQIRRLPVLDDERSLVGMVSLADLAQHRTNSAQLGETLRAVTRTNRPLSEAGEGRA